MHGVNLFEKAGLIASQVLLTREDFESENDPKSSRDLNST
jgi:glutamate 5-kinase